MSIMSSRTNNSIPEHQLPRNHNKYDSNLSRHPQLHHKDSDNSNMIMSDVNLKDQRIDRDRSKDKELKEKHNPRLGDTEHITTSHSTEAKVCSILINHIDPKDSFLVDENLEHNDTIKLIKS